MTSAFEIFERTFRKFARRAPLDESDREAFFSLPFELRIFEQHRYISREGDRAPGATLILDGLAYRHKVTVEGARQILSLHIPGDFVDLEGALLTVADHNVQALTQCNVAVIPRAAIVSLIDSHARLAHAMWIDTLVDGSIFREWITNVGRRDARTRMAHLLCEFAVRLRVAGLGRDTHYELPMTQEQLADATGLTPVHVNRTIKGLEKDGLIERPNPRSICIGDWRKLAEVGEFDTNYLHLREDEAVLR